MKYFLLSAALPLVSLAIVPVIASSFRSHGNDILKAMGADLALRADSNSTASDCNNEYTTDVWTSCQDVLLTFNVTLAVFLSFHNGSKALNGTNNLHRTLLK